MNKGVPLFVGICCVWPLIFHFAITYGVKIFTSRDWSGIRWSDLKFPWSKDQ